MRKQKFMKGGRIFYRVNKMRRCLICGAASGCFYTEDEAISYCCRRTEEFAGSARRLRVTATGLGVYSHEGASWLHAIKLLGNYKSPNEPKAYEEPSEEVAPEVIATAYAQLVRLSPAKNHPELIAADDGLAARRLGELSEFYGALPGNPDKRIELVEMVCAAMQAHFPQRDPARMVAGVPGFWFDQKQQKWMIGPPQEWRGARLLIPVRSPQGEIRALQIRTNKQEREQHPDLPKYFFLSSANYPEGTRLKRAPIHYTDFLAEQLEYTQVYKETTLLITEWPLKADTVTAISQGRLRAIANSGVDSSHRELVGAAVEFYKESGAPVYVAFDADAKENKMVVTQLARLISLLALAALEPVILGWDHGKGIDDALLGHDNIYKMRFDEWFRSLPEELQHQAIETYRQTIDMHRNAQSELVKTEDSIDLHQEIPNAQQNLRENSQDLHEEEIDIQINDKLH